MGWSDYASGAGQGAVGGAMAGAPLGPWGIAGGALIGGALGAFGSKPNPYEDRLNAFANQAAPQAGPAAQGAYSDFRGNQQDLVRMLEAQARGEGPSLAAQQLKAASDRGGRQAQSLAAGAQGPNAALAQFQAQATSGGLSAQAAQDAAAARIQEQYNAQNQLGLTLHGARGADENMNQFNAAAQNQTALANLEAQGLTRSQALQALSGAAGLSGGRDATGQGILAGGAGTLAQWVANRGNQPQGGGNQRAAGGMPGWGPMGGGQWRPGPNGTTTFGPIGPNGLSAGQTNNNGAWMAGNAYGGQGG